MFLQHFDYFRYHSNHNSELNAFLNEEINFSTVSKHIILSLKSLS